MTNRRRQTFGGQQMPVLTHHYRSHHHRSHHHRSHDYHQGLYRHQSQTTKFRMAIEFFALLRYQDANSLMVINGETMFRKCVKELDACRE